MPFFWLVALCHVISKKMKKWLTGVKSILVEINDEFEQQSTESTRYLCEAGFVLGEKKHAAELDETVFKHCFNQIWYRNSQ